MSFSTLRVSSLCILGLLLACVRTPTDIERDYAQTLRPSSLTPHPTGNAPAAAPSGPTAASRALSVRVYADEGFRSENLRWREKAEALFSAANRVVEPQLGVHFVAVDFVAWNRPSAHTDLAVALAELRDKDPGEDVDLVLGLVGSLNVVSASQEELGYAYAFGAQAVIRNMESPAELEALQATFKHLPDAERESLYQERKVHKEVSVFLHEWAHTLGAFHVSDTAFMMSPAYEPQQAQFAPETLKLLRLALEYSPSSRKSRTVQREFGVKLAALLAEPHGHEGDGPDREAAVKWAELASKGEAPLGVNAHLAAADAQTLKEATAAYQAGRLELAENQLVPLVARYPENAQVQSLACIVDGDVRPGFAKEECASAARRFPEQPYAPMVLARLQLNADDHEGAAKSIATFRARLVGASASNRQLWGNLAMLSRAEGQISWAEEAAAQMEPGQVADEMKSWATRTRRWLAIPSKGAIPTDREWRFGQLVHDVEKQLDRGSLAKAKSSMAKLEKEFPNAPMHSVLECGVEFRAGRFEKAESACRAALSRAPEAVEAHYLSALIGLRRTKRAEAQAQLEKVIALDPTYRDAWVTLGTLYRSFGMQREREALRPRFRAQFSAELP